MKRCTLLMFLFLLGMACTYHLFPSHLFAASHLECTESSDTDLVNDSDDRIIYSGPWGPKTDHGVDYHFAPYPLDGKTITENLGATAALSFQGSSIRIGSIAMFNRGYMEISIDNKKVETFSMYGTFGDITWNSPQLSCANHRVTISQSDKKGGNGGRGIVLDYFQVTRCDTGEKIYKCVSVDSPGENKDGCKAVGQSCTKVVNSPHPTPSQKPTISIHRETPSPTVFLQSPTPDNSTTGIVTEVRPSTSKVLQDSLIRPNQNPNSIQVAIDSFISRWNFHRNQLIQILTQIAP
jgi:hypothetical protein